MSFIVWCKKMKRLFVVCFLVSLVAVAAYALGDGRVSMDKQKAASKSLQRLFEAKGRGALLALSDHPDSMVALHAAWEHGKGDQKKTTDFIARFKSKLKVTPPEWWQDRLKGVVVYETCHYIPGIDPSKLKVNSRISDDRFDVVASPSQEGTGGFGYSVSVSYRKTNKKLWEGDVWAAGRMKLAGYGVHQIELVISDGRLFIFGAESHGAYAEAFNLESGVPIIRFCSCYWFNHSEGWNLR